MSKFLSLIYVAILFFFNQLDFSSAPQMQEKTVYIACKRFSEDACALQSHACELMLELGSNAQFNWTFLLDFEDEQLVGQFELIGNCIPAPWIRQSLPSNCRVANFQEKEYRARPEEIDFVVCLGGDGTILNVAHRFQHDMPPILAFNFGSLGFLSTFSFDQHRATLSKLMNGQLALLQRRRIRCKVLHYDEVGGSYTMTEVHALNEILVSRKESSHMVMLDMFSNGRLVTTVHSDGIIFATPSGSTAYSLSAGGCLVHPDVECILFTPVCPHTLSMRPMILPAGTKLTVRLNGASRCDGTIFCDAKTGIPLNERDSVEITVSPYPVNCFVEDAGHDQWFESLCRCLHWNSKAFNSCHAQEPQCTS